jgi:TRAP-type C4-dicarboxylate transport system substrate-binding protein
MMSGLGSRIMRSAFATSLLAVVASIASPLAAQEIKLRLAHVAPPQSTYQEAAVRFADELKKLSGGAMTVDIVPGGTLGDLGQLWVQNRQGSLDLHLIDVSAIVAMREARAFSALWAPFAFRDQAHLYAFFATDLFKDMMAAVEKETGVVWLGVAGDRPPRALSTASKSVVKPADLAGQKIRTPEHPVVVATFKAWGAIATPLKASELFVALRSGAVDGQDNGSIDFLAAGYADVQKIYVPIDYIHSAVGIWISGQRWRQLDDRQQGWLRDATRKAGEDGRRLHDAAMAAAMKGIVDKGVTVTKPDIGAFREASKPVIAEFEGKLWPAGLYEKIGAVK